MSEKPSFLQNIEEHRREVSPPYRDVYDDLVAENMNPDKAAAALAYIESQVNKDGRTQAEVADKFGITKTTLRDGLRTAEDRVEWYTPRANTKRKKFEILESLAEICGWSEGRVEDGNEYHTYTSRGRVSNLGPAALQDLTGQQNNLNAARILQREYDLIPGDDFTVGVNINKSGLLKIEDKVQENAE